MDIGTVSDLRLRGIASVPYPGNIDGFSIGVIGEGRLHRFYAVRHRERFCDVGVFKNQCHCLFLTPQNTSSFQCGLDGSGGVDAGKVGAVLLGAIDVFNHIRVTSNFGCGFFDKLGFEFLAP